MRVVETNLVEHQLISRSAGATSNKNNKIYSTSRVRQDDSFSRLRRSNRKMDSSFVRRKQASKSIKIHPFTLTLTSRVVPLPRKIVPTKTPSKNTADHGPHTPLGFVFLSTSTREARRRTFVSPNRPFCREAARRTKRAGRDRQTSVVGLCEGSSSSTSPACRRGSGSCHCTSARTER